MGALEKIRNCKRGTFKVNVTIDGEVIEFVFKYPRQSARQEMLSSLPPEFMSWAMRNKESLNTESDSDISDNLPDGVNMKDIMRMQSFMPEWCIKNEVVIPEGLTADDADYIINEWDDKTRNELYAGIIENLEKLNQEIEQAPKNSPKTA